MQAYRGLETRYRSLSQIEKPTLVDDLLELDAELAELRQGQTATVSPQWFEE